MGAISVIILNEMTGLDLPSSAQWEFHQEAAPIHICAPHEDLQAKTGGKDTKNRQSRCQTNQQTPLKQKQATLYLPISRQRKDFPLSLAWSEIYRSGKEPLGCTCAQEKKNKGKNSKGLWQAVRRAKPFTWRCSVTCTCKLSCPPKHSGSQCSLKTNSGGIWLKCSKLFRSVTTLTSGAEIRCWRFECCGVFARWEDRWELTLKRDQRGTLLLSQGASWGLVWPHHAPCCAQRWKENNMSMSASKRNKNKLKTKVFLSLANNQNDLHLCGQFI